MSSDYAQGGRMPAQHSAPHSNRKRTFVVWATVIVLFAIGGGLYQHNEEHFRDTQRDQGRHLASTQRQLAVAERQLAAALARVEANCRLIDKSNATFDFELNQLIRNASHSTGLTTKQKEQALAAYAKLRLPIVPCSSQSPT